MRWQFAAIRLNWKPSRSKEKNVNATRDVKVAPLSDQMLCAREMRVGGRQFSFPELIFASPLIETMDSEKDNAMKLKKHARAFLSTTSITDQLFRVG